MIWSNVKSWDNQYHSYLEMRGFKFKRESENKSDLFLEKEQLRIKGYCARIITKMRFRKNYYQLWIKKSVNGYGGYNE